MDRDELSRLVQARQGIRGLAARVAEQVAVAFREAKDARQLERDLVQALKKLPPLSTQGKPREDADWNGHELIARSDVRAAVRLFLARHLAYEGPVRDASALLDVSPIGLAGLFSLLTGDGVLQLPVPDSSHAPQLNESDAYLWSLFPWLLKPKQKFPSTEWATFLGASHAQDVLALARSIEVLSRSLWPESSSAFLSPIGLRWTDCTAFRGLRRALVRERLSASYPLDEVPKFFTGMLALTKRQGAATGTDVLTFQVPGVAGCPIGLCAMAAEGAHLAHGRRRQGAQVAADWGEVARALVSSCPHPKAHLLLDF
jgi:hypothetical protein